MLRLVFSLGIFSVEMTSFMFLSQRRDTPALFYLFNIETDTHCEIFFPRSPNACKCTHFQITLTRSGLPASRGVRGVTGKYGGPQRQLQVCVCVIQTCVSNSCWKYVCVRIRVAVTHLTFAASPLTHMK